jgi:hypothetical protein
VTDTRSAELYDELAGRCEASAGPDRELDRAIAPLTGLRVLDEGHPLGWCCYDKDGHGAPLPSYTASLDAAMQLVPEGCSWNLHKHSCWARACVFVDDGRDAGHYCDCATPALALTAAALRARAAS